jgi:hypothetical protein
LRKFLTVRLPLWVAGPIGPLGRWADSQDGSSWCASSARSISGDDAGRDGVVEKAWGGGYVGTERGLAKDVRLGRV